MINNGNIPPINSTASNNGNGIADDFEDDSDRPDDSGTANMSSWTLWAGYQLSFNYKFNATGNISVSGVSSSLIGMHLGVSWEQSQTQSFTNYPGSTLIYFDVQGYQKYNIIVEGIGTVFTQEVHLTGVYNTKTGAYTLDVE